MPPKAKIAVKPSVKIMRAIRKIIRLGIDGSDLIVCQSSVAAECCGSFGLRGVLLSGTNRKNGMMKIANHTAANGPVMRSL